MKFLLPFIFAFCTSLFSQNVVLIQADDLGVDKVSAYNYPGCPSTPNIDSLANNGLQFTSCYSNPVCSPTRSTIITGQYAWRSLLGRAIPPAQDYGLDPTLPTLLPKVIPSNFYKIALGKWHMSAPSVGGPWHPIICGFDLFLGTEYNIPNNGSYFNYQKTFSDINQSITYTSNVYSTLDITNDCVSALEFLNSQSNPFFIYCNYHAAHAPFHYPPGMSGPVEINSYHRSKAMVQYMDNQIARILTNINWQNTTVIFVGDNGSAPGTTYQFNYFRGVKGTVYEGGIRVPLFMKGQAITKLGITEKLVNTVDLYQTIIDITNLQSIQPQLDSHSLYPYINLNGQTTRTYSYSEYFWPNGSLNLSINNKAIRNEQFKLVSINDNGISFQEFFDLSIDPLETNPIPLNQLTQFQQINYNNLLNNLLNLGL